MKKKLILLFLVLFASIKANKTEYLVNHVKRSIKNAKKHESKLITDILQLEGLSSHKVRHLLNNICSLPEACYLEIGVWKGATFISALYGNTSTLTDAVAIDNWSEFASSNEIFLGNTQKFLPHNCFRFFNQHSFNVNPKSIFSKKINIYFYDGDHSMESQKKAFTFFNNVLDDTFIAIVDDWNWEQVKSGTRAAFDELHYQIIFEKELPGYYTFTGDRENWWNGLYVAVIQKK